MCNSCCYPINYPPLTLPEPPLQAEEFFLRPPERGDVDDIVEHCQDPLIARFTAIPVPYDLSHAYEYVQEAGENWKSGKGVTFSIIARGDFLPEERVIGSISATRKPWDPAVAEIGYWVAPHARQRGIATRALRLVSRWAMNEMGLARIQLGTNQANHASQRVATKAGFTREGILRSWREIRGVRVDEVHFSLLPEDL